MNNYFVLRFNKGPFTDGRGAPIATFYVKRGKETARDQAAPLSRELADGLAKRYADRAPQIEERLFYVDLIFDTYAQVDELEPAVSFERAVAQGIRELGREQVLEIINKQVQA